ncbi:MAG: ABC transporter substrate-binding protein [Cardiobacteriaceae bacterium]|nr:ABC transporter substrate-binding protein [Cardiobacteriaceae bacterium]
MKHILVMLCTLIFYSPLYAAERIVSTAGYASEIIALLGKDSLLVGVDTTSMLPSDIMEHKAKIGYRRQLSAEGILALNPDLILLARDAAPANAVDQIRGSGVPLLMLEDQQTLDGIRSEISKIGTAIGAEDAAKALIQRIEKDEETLAQAKKGSGTALVLLNTGSSGVYALGKNSAGDHLLNILGLKNAVDFDGHKPMTTEAFIATPADILLVTAREDATVAPVISKIAAEDTRYNSVAPTAAAKRDCAFAVNILSALGFGANTARDATQIAKTIAPCLHE